MSSPDQFDLFETPPASGGSPVPVAVTDERRTLGKEHKAFNRLAGKVQRLRESLSTWQDYSRQYDIRVSGELQPAEAAVRDAQGRLMRRLDALARATARGERLTRAERRALGRHIAMIAADLLAHGESDPETEALHDAYAATPHAELRRAEMDEVEAMLGEMLGADAVAGHAARSAEEMFEHVRARVEAEARPDSGATGPGTSRTRRLAARKAAERSEALGTVRAIWRRLASAVHPDREPDPAERARKTSLMQRANEAYEHNDVLTLLSLQIELEQIDADHLASAPPQRLKQFMTVMKEQAAALEEELEVLLLRFRMLLDQPRGRLQPQMVDRALDEDLAEMRKMAQGIEEDLARLDHPETRRALLDMLVAEDATFMFDDDFDGLPEDEESMAALADLLLGAHLDQAPPGRRRTGTATKARKKKNKQQRKTSARSRNRR